MAQQTATTTKLAGRQLTEIGQFQLANLADEQILGFQIPVQDLAFVDVRQASQQLEQKEAHVVSL
jgi:hypothetical protein